MSDYRWFHITRHPVGPSAGFRLDLSPNGKFKRKANAGSWGTVKVSICSPNTDTLFSHRALYLLKSESHLDRQLLAGSTLSGPCANENIAKSVV